MKSYYLCNEAETLFLAKRVAAFLQPNDVILLNGPLGAGKTCFVRGIASYYGCEDQVSSPTFALVNQYDTKQMTLYHFDLYRLRDEQELVEAGIDELFYAGGVSLIEWPQNAYNLLNGMPVSCIEFAYDQNGRALTFTGPLEERIG